MLRLRGRLFLISFFVFWEGRNFALAQKANSVFDYETSKETSSVKPTAKPMSTAKSTSKATFKTTKSDNKSENTKVKSKKKDLSNETQTGDFKITEEFLKMNELRSEDTSQSVPVVDPKSLPVYKSHKVSVDDLPEDNGPPPRVEIIVDSSGSMGQLLNSDKTKMFYLKKIMNRFYSEQWKEVNQNSLRVYGARRRNDCDDTYLAIPPGLKSLSEIEKRVKAMYPVGRTPIYKTIKLAINNIKSYKGPKRIVIFTDGEDTCGGDPCKLTKETLLAQTLDIKFYVIAIGFPPGKDSLKKMKCIGDTLKADNENELFNALGEVNGSIHKGGINLKVISPNPTAFVQLFRYKPDGTMEMDRIFTSSFGAKVDPGDYEAVVMLEPPFRFPRFTIPPKKRVTLQVIGEGQAAVKFHDQLLTIEMLDKNAKAVTSFPSDTPSTVPAGRYKMRVSREPFFSKLIEPVLIIPDGQYETEITDAGAVIFKTENIEGFYIYDSNDKFIGNFLTNFPLVLPRGVFRIHLNDQCSFDNIRIDYSGKIETLTCGKMRNNRILRVLNERGLSLQQYKDQLKERIEKRKDRLKDPSLPVEQPDILLDTMIEEEMIDFIDESIKNNQKNTENNNQNSNQDKIAPKK